MLLFSKSFALICVLDIGLLRFGKDLVIPHNVFASGKQLFDSKRFLFDIEPIGLDWFANVFQLDTAGPF